EKYEEPPEIWSVEEKSIEKIDMRLPAEKKSVSFIIGPDEYWDFNEPNRPPVDLKRWGGIVLLLTGPQSRRLVAQKMGNPSDFGLDRPQLIINLGIRDKDDLEIHVGDSTPNGDAFYVRVKGSDQLYMVDQTWMEVMTRLVREPPREPVESVKPLKR
ncbi:MAG: DUF4340 domain-containing protein, partial [Deltaproteobacteria bacterium]|nr:DUF4340 domain-containing protein [Deltaproteobacteria bacterium]